MATPPANREPPPEQGFWERAQNVLQVAGGIAALVGLVWLVGGAVMWLRFHKADIPADAAVAVMSREQLFVVGFRLMILPAFAAGLLALLLVKWVEPQDATNHRPTPPSAACEPEANVEEPRRVKRWTTRHPRLTFVGVAVLVGFLLYVLFRTAEAVASAIGESRVVIIAPVALLAVTGVIAWRRSPKRWPLWVGSALFAMWLCLLPISWASLVWVAAAFSAIWYAWPKLRSPRKETEHDSGTEHESRSWLRRPVVVVGLAAGFAVSVALAQQTDQPVQLLHADATLTQGKTKRIVKGVFVAADASSVYVGRTSDDKIISLKKDEIRRLALGPPDIIEPNPSLLSEVMDLLSDDVHRFSTKGYAWWCDGVQYSWGGVLDQRFCHTQPQVLAEQYAHVNTTTITREKADPAQTTTRHLHGRFAPVRVGCPTVAERPCRGFVWLISQRKFRSTRWEPTSRIELGPAPLPQRDLQPSGAAEVCVGLSGNDLYRIRRAGIRRVEFTAVVSSDEARENVLDKSPYFLQIPARPQAATGERDASDCPPGLQVFGIQVTPRYVSDATPTLRLTYHVNRAATVSVTLRNRAGRLIRPLVRRERVSPEGKPVLRGGKRIDTSVRWPMITGSGNLWDNTKTLEWDAVDRTGHKLAEGGYQAALVAVGDDGATVRARGSFAIDATPPRVRVINGGTVTANDALVMEVTDRASGIRETLKGGRCTRTQLTVNGKTVRGPRCAWLRDDALWLAYRPEDGWQVGTTYAWSITAEDRAGHPVGARGRVVARVQTGRAGAPPGTPRHR